VPRPLSPVIAPALVPRRPGDEPVDRRAGHGVTQHVLDLARAAHVQLGYERQRFSGSMGASGATDAVNVLLGMHGDVEVDDQVDIVNVQPSRGDVRGDEHVEDAGRTPSTHAHD
jgi:hypothetical protein